MSLAKTMQAPSRPPAAALAPRPGLRRTLKGRPTLNYAAAILLALCAGCAPSPNAPAPATPAAPTRRLSFLDDDYERALSLAKSRGVPLFVEAGPPSSHWAQWMRTWTLTDPALARHADRFVWLSMDSERETNAPFFAKFSAAPTVSLFVIDSKTETEVVREDRQLSVRGLELLFDAADLTIKGGATGLEARLVAADGLRAAGKPSAASEAYLKLAEDAPPSWKYRTLAISSAIATLEGGDAEAQCALIARRFLPTLRGVDAALIANLGLECALDSAEGAPLRKESIVALEPVLKGAVDSPPAGLEDVDLSQFYRHLIRVRDDAKDKAGAKEIAARWLPLLDRLAAKAPTPQARAVFDVHRFIACMTLEKMEPLIEAMQATERDMPSNYLAPNYLSAAYRKLGRLDDALAANERALTKAYGAYKTRILNARASLYLARGERDAARGVMAEALAYAKTLSPALRPPWVLPLLEQRLKDVE